MAHRGCETGMRKAATVLVALLVFLGTTCAAPKSREQALLDWVVSKGGKAPGVKIGATEEGHRGLLAKKKIKKGDTVVSIPLSLAIPLGLSNQTGPELGIILLREKYKKPNHFGAYIAALPGEMDVLCAEFIPQILIPLLRRHELEELVEAKVAWFYKVMMGEAEGLSLPLRTAIPMEVELTEDEFKWAVCMANSRSLATPLGAMYLIPVIDMANHAAQANCEVRFVAEKEQRMELVALDDIRPEEEVTISYGPLRNDEATLFYGFSMVGDMAYKQLCAVDTPNYAHDLQPGKHEHVQYGPGDDPKLIRKELERLQKRLDYYLNRADQGAYDHYKSVQLCKDPDWKDHGMLEEEPRPEEEDRSWRAGFCDAIVNKLDIMIQVCDAALEWEVYRLQQLLSPTGSDIEAGEGDPDAGAEL